MATILRFEVPGHDEPGYLRRTRQALEFSNAWESGNRTPEMVDKLVNFLVQFVAEPQGQEAIDALWDASETQITELIASISGGGANPTA